MTGNEPSKIISFQCVSCGSPVPIRRPGQSLTFVCGSCGTVMDEDNEGVKILRQTQVEHYKSLFELGAKVQFRGDKWQILGFMVRSDGERSFFWREYLLFNPKQGYRFLMEAEGHWSFVTLVKHMPNVHDYWKPVRWGGRGFRPFYRGTAICVYVLGEFYWRVRVEESVEVYDYICPPETLSLEKTAAEETWSVGTYIPPDDIQKDFLSVMVGTMPEPKGVAPNQPAPHESASTILLNWLLFAVVIFLIQVIFFRGDNKVLLTQTLMRSSTIQETLSSEPFVVEKDDTNIELQLQSDLANTWLSVKGTVVPEEGQDQTFQFARELSAYSGVDDGEAWSESNRSVKLFFPHMRAGRYHLNFELSSDSVLTNNVRGTNPGDSIWVEVTNDVTILTPFWTVLILLSGLPFLKIVRGWMFESKRYSGSNLAGSV